MTIVDVFRERVRALGARPALRRRRDGAWHALGWDEYGSAVEEVAAGLVAAGVEAGDRVALLSTNRVEWHFADLGILCAGAVTVPVYPTSAAVQAAYVVDHCEARVAFVENIEQLAKLLDEREHLPLLRAIVLFEGAAGDEEGVIDLAELRELGRGLLDREPDCVDRRSGAVTTDDLATIVYTSGTTGPPKGALITHGNLTAGLDSLTRLVPIGPGDRFLSFLPLSHVAERIVSDFGQIVSGGETWFARSLAGVAEDVRACRPTVFFAVPRVWQKVRDAVAEEIDSTKGLRRLLVERYLSLGRRRLDHDDAGDPMRARDRVLLGLLERIVGAKIRVGIGLDAARVLVSGAAPIHPELQGWLHAAGLPVNVVYGQTEDCGPTTMNPPGRIRIGTVGRPLPGVDVRIADDSEILVKGPNVCRGYFKNEAATRELLDENGWMHSGDLGHFDGAGYLCVTGRKKDLIVTAQGKNVAPQEIEATLRVEHLIAEAVVVGDGRPYLAALLTLDTDALAPWAQARGKPLNAEVLAWDPDVHREIEASIARVNAGLSNPERIRKWRILPDDFTIAAGELTPTLKVRRQIVGDRYAELIEEIYAEPATRPAR